MFWPAMKMMMGLGIVLVLLFFFMRFVRRSGLVPQEGAPWLRLIATQPIGPRKQISIVEVSGEVLVLGVTETQVNLLHKIDDPTRMARILSDGPHSFRPGPWLVRWMGTLHRRLQGEEALHER